jgi:hypothetical protein
VSQQPEQPDLAVLTHGAYTLHVTEDNAVSITLEAGTDTEPGYALIEAKPGILDIDRQ